MERINIQGAEDTPNVVLDLEKNLYEISGRSLPEDVVTFYKPVMDWLEELEKSPIDGMKFDVRLDYFNTASSKILLDIFLKLDEIHGAGVDIRVRWYYSELDEDLAEAGEEYSELVEIPFDVIAVQQDSVTV